MVRSQIQLTEEQFRSLKTASARTGKSMAELIRQAVDRFVSSSDIDPRRRERAVASIVDSGRGVEMSASGTMISWRTPISNDDLRRHVGSVRAAG